MEKRKFKRFKAPYGAYVALMPDAKVVGALSDISSGGLSFQYLVTDAAGQDASPRMAIFVSSSGYYMGSVPFRIVRDFELNPENPFSTISMRLCGVEFGDLTGRQKKQLAQFIENYAFD